jgi:hypothetical protein
MKPLKLCLVAAFQVDKALMEQLAGALRESKAIKPGMPRTKLSKAFTTKGGLSTARRRTYVYRGCRYIRVDIDFSLSSPKQGVLDERSTDKIAKISKPYLDWSIDD